MSAYFVEPVHVSFSVQLENNFPRRIHWSLSPLKTTIKRPMFLLPADRHQPAEVKLINQRIITLTGLSNRSTAISCRGNSVLLVLEVCGKFHRSGTREGQYVQSIQVIKIFSFPLPRLRSNC